MALPLFATAFERRPTDRTEKCLQLERALQRAQETWAEDIPTTLFSLEGSEEFGFRFNGVLSWARRDGRLTWEGAGTITILGQKPEISYTGYITGANITARKITYGNDCLSICDGKIGIADVQYPLTYDRNSNPTIAHDNLLITLAGKMDECGVVKTKSGLELRFRLDFSDGAPTLIPGLKLPTEQLFAQYALPTDILTFLISSDILTIDGQLSGLHCTWIKHDEFWGATASKEGFQTLLERIRSETGKL